MRGSVCYVVSRIPWPQIVSNQHCVAFSAHFLSAEGTFNLLVACFVQKVILKNAVVLLQCCCFQVVLHFPKVNIVLNLKCVTNRKTSECVVDSNFVLICQFDCTFRHDAAVVLDCIDSDLQSVYFC